MRLGAAGRSWENKIYPQNILLHSTNTLHMILNGQIFKIFLLPTQPSRGVYFHENSCPPPEVTLFWVSIENDEKTLPPPSPILVTIYTPVKPSLSLDLKREMLFEIFNRLIFQRGCRIPRLLSRLSRSIRAGYILPGWGDEC